MYIPSFVIILAIAWFYWIHRQTKKKLNLAEMLKRHYLQMLFLSNKNEKEIFKMLLRKYLIDLNTHTIKDFNNLWIAISDDSEVWTIGSNYIKEKEGKVSPDISESISQNMFKTKAVKDFVSFAKYHWNGTFTVEAIKKAVDYQVHDSFGKAMSEEESAYLGRISGRPKKDDN